MNKNEHTQQFIVSGMTCGHCKAAVESAIRGTDGVQSALVDLEAGNATVEGTFEVAAILESIKEAGYEAAFQNDN